MINEKSVLAIIPARGRSKGLPGKNIKELCGKPLIAWTIEEAKKSKYIDRLILSSEDQQIIKIAKEWSCEVPFVRPAELAQDDTPGIEPVLHALKELPEKYDYVVLLQVTSPLRSVDDIDGCLGKCISLNAPACVSVTESDKSPYWMYVLDDKGYMKPFLKKQNFITRRQNLPKIYSLNGAVYVAKCQWLLETESFITEQTLSYKMPKERSLDIDEEMDLTVSECLLRNR